MIKPYQKVVDYFSTLESKLGYDFILGGVKHFGYYPFGKMDISENKAQILMMDQVATKLRLTKKDTVLDAGCGQGYTAIYLAQKYGCKITGITITPFEVEKAKKQALERNIENKVEFLKADYTKTNFPDKYFDAIYTMETLVHAYDLKKTLKEFIRILKPKGRVVFFEYSMASDEKIKKFDKIQNLNFKKLFDWTIEKGAMFSLKKMRHGAFAQILAKIGFVNVKEKDITIHIYPSMNKLYKLARIPFQVIKLINLKKFFINTTVAAEVFPILLEYNSADIFRYNITTAEKP